MLQILGTIKPPVPGGSDIGGLTILFVNILRLVFLVAGIYAFLNFILAGFAFLSASGDPKRITAAWEKIWLTIVGLLVIVISFLLAAVVGFLLFHDPLFILNPKIYGPNSTPSP
jgi:hypothetical protein